MFLTFSNYCFNLLQYDGRRGKESSILTKLSQMITVNLNMNIEQDTKREWLFTIPIAFPKSCWRIIADLIVSPLVLLPMMEIVYVMKEQTMSTSMTKIMIPYLMKIMIWSWNVRKMISWIITVTMVVGALMSGFPGMELSGKHVRCYCCLFFCASKSHICPLHHLFHSIDSF